MVFSQFMILLVPISMTSISFENWFRIESQKFKSIIKIGVEISI